MLDELKKLCSGFPIMTAIEDWTGASHRIFVYSENGPVVLLWFEKTEKLVCKSKLFLEKIKSNKKLSKLL